MTRQGRLSHGVRWISGFAVVALVFAFLGSLFASQPVAYAAAGAKVQVRVVHAVPDFGPIDVYVDGVKRFAGATFFSATEYLALDPGNLTVQVVAAGATLTPANIVTQTPANFGADEVYSIVVRGTANRRDATGVAVTHVREDNSLPPVGQARIKVAHFSPDAPAVDVYVNGAKAVSNLQRRTISDYLTVPPGNYTFGIAPAGGSVIYTTTATLAAGQVATAWANGLLAGSGAQAFKVTPTIDAQASGTARLRAVHAVPDIAGSPVDVYLDSTKVVTFDFFTATDYLTVYAGSYNLRVVLAGGNPDTAAVIQAPITLEAGKDYSAIARGTASATDAATLEASLVVDDNALPAVGQARIKVAHFSPDAPAVDIYANGAKVVSALSYLSNSPYLSVPAGSYTFGVAPAGGSVIYTTTATLAAGQVATAWANGLLAGSGAQAFKVTPTIDAQASGTARLRAVHAVPDIAGSPVDLYLDSTKVVTFDFFTATDYLNVYAGSYTLRVVLAGGNPDTDAVIKAPITLEAGKDYSAIARGTASSSDSAALGASLVVDDNTAPAAGQARIKVAHFSPDAPAVDIYANGAKVVSGLSYLSNSPYLSVPAGSYTFGVAPAGGSVIYTTTATLAAGQVATAWANGLLAGSGAQAFKVTPTIDAQASSGARLRVLHASPDAPNVDVFLNGQKAVSNLAYGTLTSYLPVAAGSYQVQIRVANSETTVFTGSISLADGKSYTAAAIGLVASGAANPFTVKLFEDDTTRSADGKAKVRFVHLAPNAPTVDVRTGSTVLFDDVTFAASAGYISVAPGTVPLAVTSANGQQTFLSANVTPKLASVTTIFALGLAGEVPAKQQLRALVATDTAPATSIYLPDVSR